MGSWLAWGEEKKEEKRAAEIEEIVVTATKTESALSDVPFTVHVVTPKEIQSQPNYYISNFGELIRDLPGVHVGQYYPWGPPWIILRGAGHFLFRTVYMVDSVPIPAFVSTCIHPNDIEKIEVLLGPSSALYGPNAMGGVVNIITKKGKKDTGIKLDIGRGSRDTYRPHLELGNQVATKIGKFHYYASYSGDYSDGYRMVPYEVAWYLHQGGQTGWMRSVSLQRDKYRYHFYASKIGWENESGAGIWLGYHHQDMWLGDGRPNRILNDHGEEGAGTLRFYLPVGEIMKVTGTAGYQLHNRPGEEDTVVYAAGRFQRFDPRPSTKSEWEVDRYPLELQIDLFPFKNHITTLGGSFLKEVEFRRTKHAFTYVPSAESRYKTDHTSLYFQHQSFLFSERLNITAGLRFDRWKYHDIFDLASRPQNPPSMDFDNLSYRGGVRFKISDAISLRSSFGTGFFPGLTVARFVNIPTGGTRREANPDLKPEKTWMVDGGADIELKAWKTSLSLTPYYGRIKDLISYHYFSMPGYTLIKAYNLGRLKIYGVETQLKVHLTEHLDASLSFTVNRTRIFDDPRAEYNQLANCPDYHGSFVLTYKNPDLLSGRIGIRYSDDRYYDNEVQHLKYYHMRPYATVDLKLWRDFKLGKGILTPSLSVDNLFDKKYETEFIYMSPGRSIQFNLGYRYLF
ncbi:MAG: TonB-dependent receptor [Desulfobacterota bacterium]|nr:TonB-dependent receptor [Thermodesulfobacteriota bacterium]